MKNKRQNEIIRLLEESGSVSTEALAEDFGVSLATIRRDFDELEAAGVLLKKYGGAELNPVHAHTLLPFRNRQGLSLSEKQAMAEKAAEYIRDNSIIAIDAGSTMYELCKRLSGKHNLLVLSNDIYTADMALRSGDSRVYLMGGFLTPYGTSSGSYAESFISGMSRIDLFFTSCDAASLEDGLTTDEQMINDLKRLYFSKAKKKIALIDSSKFEKTAFFKMCDFRDIDILITDKGLSSELIAKLEAECVDVVIAD